MTETEKRGPGRPPKMMQFEVRRDYWKTDGERVRKGTIVEMRAEDAIDGIEAGALKKA